MKPIKNRNIPDISVGNQFPGSVLFSKSTRCKSFPQIDGMDSYVSIVIDIRYAMDDEIN